jgi:HlyD family secretion protein
VAARKKKYKLPLAIVVLAVMALLVWHFWPKGPGLEAPHGKSVEVQKGLIRQLVTSTGTVTTQVGATVKVGARVSGRVEKLLVAVGQKVEAGQVVAVIEHKDLQAKLEQARAELNEVRVQLKQAKLDLKRRDQLVKDDMISREEADQARREVEVLGARLTAAEARLVTARINLEYATIKAPISGVVAEVSTQEGETVAASLSAPTFITIVDLGRLQVDDYVDETDVGMVKAGQRAWFTVDAFSNRRFKGKVQAIHPSAKIIDNVVYYTVIIEIEDDYKGLLKPEMTANVSIVVNSKPDALWVPSEAVRRKGGREIVYLVTGQNQVRSQTVRSGWSEQNRMEITKGLKEGQVVIVPQTSAMQGRPGSNRGH